MDMAKIYCGTYAKYNDGNLAGEWIDLERFGSKEEFLEECKRIHSDESDPELMFQDYEGFPRSLYSESFVNEQLFEWLALSESEQLAVAAYWDNYDCSVPIDEILERFYGSYSSLEDYVIEFWEECGEYKRDEKNWWSPINYVDWEAMARDLQMSGDVCAFEHEHQIYVFRSC